MARSARLLIVVLLVSIPIVAHFAYSWLTAMPAEVVIGTGPEGGRYRVVAQGIGREIERRLHLRVRYAHTAGSLENLERLQAGGVDLALYEPGTREVLGGARAERVRFIATLYMQPVHLMVRSGSGIGGIAELRGKRIDVGPRGSGDNAMSQVLLSHLGLDEGAYEPRYLSYTELEAAFAAEEVEAAVATVGVPAATLGAVLRSGSARLIEVPFRDALIMRHVALSESRIPAGAYGLALEPVPPEDVPTVAASAQLLVRDSLHAGLVEAVTEIVHDASFQRDHQLRDLFEQGTAFSRLKPELPIHAGALHYHAPELRPLLDPDFVEATEGIRSFVVSLGIALYMVYRWLRRRRVRSQEHRLDRYIHRLLEIERRQVGLDESADGGDLEVLQGLLDEVTALRQDALKEFTAHDLGEDPGIDCFIEMSHALSNKVNAKISRQRHDRAMRALTDAVEELARGLDRERTG